MAKADAYFTLHFWGENDNSCKSACSISLSVKFSKRIIYTLIKFCRFVLYIILIHSASPSFKSIFAPQYSQHL